MKRQTINRPKVIEVRGCRYVFSDAPAHWTENAEHELYCDKCGHPLVVLFGARQAADITKENLRWWIPTAMSCSCLLPEAVALREAPIMRRRRRRDGRQLELQL